MPQFIITSENITETNVFLKNKEDINHIVNVLRLSQGDKVVFIEPNGFVYETEILNIEKNILTATIIKKYISEKKLKKVKITLAQSIIKSQKQDFVIQKATELGVSHIIPVLSKNTVVKINNDKENKSKVEKWEKIAYESVKQCERSDIPTINPIITLKQLMLLNDFDVKFVCTERNSDLTIKKYLSSQNIDKSKTISILIIIGPEGGWDDSEIELFNKNKISQVSLGSLILRAETASINAISNVVYEYEL